MSSPSDYKIEHGVPIDFVLSERRNSVAAHRFLRKALTVMKDWPPSSITTEQLGSYPKAIDRLKREGRLYSDTMHRTSKYLNNILEADHGALKQGGPSDPRLSENEDR